MWLVSLLKTFRFRGVNEDIAVRNMKHSAWLNLWRYLSIFRKKPCCNLTGKLWTKKIGSANLIQFSSSPSTSRRKSEYYNKYRSGTRMRRLMKNSTMTMMMTMTTTKKTTTTTTTTTTVMKTTMKIMVAVKLQMTMIMTMTMMVINDDDDNGDDGDEYVDAVKSDVHSVVDDR